MSTTPPEVPTFDTLLLAGARSMDDFALKQRIQAAVLYKANILLQGASGTNAWNYAVSALLRPHDLDPTMMALVSTSQAVANLITVDAKGETVDTSQVPDSLIISTVDAKWPLVSSKYKLNPLA